MTLIEYRSGLISLLSLDARTAFHRTVLELRSAPFSIGAPDPTSSTPSWCEPDPDRARDRFGDLLGAWWRECAKRS
ncbi:hypothetical protein [Terrabacter sp. Root181]|uniref:hypothetical protein n=1 Tax=Terrabacter sp. Root181 TaxID=1736484 RepID=UPI00138F8170|nr:hypothetical protein [Terrabacter sp. Root181]